MCESIISIKNNVPLIDLFNLCTVVTIFLNFGFIFKFKLFFIYKMIDMCLLVRDYLSLVPITCNLYNVCFMFYLLYSLSLYEYSTEFNYDQ